MSPFPIETAALVVRAVVALEVSRALGVGHGPPAPSWNRYLPVESDAKAMMEAIRTLELDGGPFGALTREVVRLEATDAWTRLHEQSTAAPAVVADLRQAALVQLLLLDLRRGIDMWRRQVERGKRGRSVMLDHAARRLARLVSLIAEPPRVPVESRTIPEVMFSTKERDGVLDVSEALIGTLKELEKELARVARPPALTENSDALRRYLSTYGDDSRLLEMNCRQVLGVRPAVLRAALGYSPWRTHSLSELMDMLDLERVLPVESPRWTFQVNGFTVEGFDGPPATEAPTAEARPTTTAVVYLPHDRRHVHDDEVERVVDWRSIEVLLPVRLGHPVTRVRTWGLPGPQWNGEPLAGRVIVALEPAKPLSS
jgi:hypothetical protein